MAKPRRNGKLYIFNKNNKNYIFNKLFPDKAQIYIGALEDQEYKNQKIHSWDDIWGFDAGLIKKTAIIEVFTTLVQPLVDVVYSEQIISDKCCILDLDLENVTKEDLNFISSYK